MEARSKWCMWLFVSYLSIVILVLVSPVHISFLTLLCSYEHVITGTRRPKLPEFSLGGILADEMGLGKSLTILSAIMGSLSKAELFSQSGSQGHKRAVKTTLIIIPSVCESFCEFNGVD